MKNQIFFNILVTVGLFISLVASGAAVSRIEEQNKQLEEWQTWSKENVVKLYENDAHLYLNEASISGELNRIAGNTVIEVVNPSFLLKE